MSDMQTEEGEMRRGASAGKLFVFQCCFPYSWMWTICGLNAESTASKFDRLRGASNGYPVSSNLVIDTDWDIVSKMYESKSSV